MNETFHVTNADELNKAILSDAATIVVEEDIFIIIDSDSISISSMIGLVIFGNGHKIEVAGTERNVMIINNSDVTLHSLIITGGGTDDPIMSSDFKGGGLRITSSKVTMIGCTVTRNLAEIGAGIFLESSYLKLITCTISYNHASNNAGFKYYYPDDDGYYYGGEISYFVLSHYTCLIERSNSRPRWRPLRRLGL